MALRTCDLFAGIGGMPLGLERSGHFRASLFCEIEPFQQAVLRKHWPTVPCVPDIRDLDVVDCDVITGGFPCQPFSKAARGRNVAEDLWPEMLRVISSSHPSYVIAENVCERAIEFAACDMRALGYAVNVRSISGDDCGAPHGRRRWWAIAHPHSESEFQRALDAEVAQLPRICQGLWSASSYARALRVSDGVPHRVHRVESLGNAVIPQIPQVIGYAIARMREPQP